MRGLIKQYASIYWKNNVEIEGSDTLFLAEGLFVGG